MKKIIIAACALMLLPVPAVFGGHKIRLSAAGAYFIENGLAGAGTYSITPKITIAYPVTPRERPFNMEIGILTIYEAQLSGAAVQSPGFGFGIRIFYNEWATVRPYFNHEIMTRIVYAAGTSGAAKTYSVLLGLGLDFPLEPGREGEKPSLFADISYLFYDTGYFETRGHEVKSLGLTLGYSFPF